MIEEKMKPEVCYTDRTQLAYAGALEIVSMTVIVTIVLGYIVYLMQLPSLTVPIESVAANWHLSAADLQSRLDLPSGWSVFGSIGQLLHGDVLSFVSILFLCMSTLLCLVRVLPTFMKEGNRLYALITVLQVLVLLLAATGIFGGPR